MNLLIWLVWPVAPGKEFWVRYCELKELQQTLCFTCSQKIKSRHNWMHVINWKNSWKLIITGDKSYCHSYDPEIKQQWRQWKHSMSPHLKKSMSSECWFASLMQKKLSTEFVPLDQTLTKNVTWQFTSSQVLFKWPQYHCFLYGTNTYINAFIVAPWF